MEQYKASIRDHFAPIPSERGWKTLNKGNVPTISESRAQTNEKTHHNIDTSESPRPASLVELESQFTEEQLAALRRVAVLLAASAMKIAREKGMLR